MKIYTEIDVLLSIEQQEAVKRAARKAGFAEANVTMFEKKAVPGTMIVFSDETGKREKTILL